MFRYEAIINLKVQLNILGFQNKLKIFFNSINSTGFLIDVGK